MGSSFLLLLISLVLLACNILATSCFRAQYTRNLLPCDLATSHNGRGTLPSNYKLRYVAYKPRAHEPRAGRGGLISPIGRPGAGGKSKPHEKWISREGGAENPGIVKLFQERMKLHRQVECIPILESETHATEHCSASGHESVVKRRPYTNFTTERHRRLRRRRLLPSDMCASELFVVASDVAVVEELPKPIR